MRLIERFGWRRWLACVASYLVLLQAVLAAANLAPLPSQAYPGDFASVLCTHDGAGDTAPSRHPAHHTADCCLAGACHPGCALAPTDVALFDSRSACSVQPNLPNGPRLPNAACVVAYRSRAPPASI